LKHEVVVFLKTTKNILTAFNSFNRCTDLEITKNGTNTERSDHVGKHITIYKFATKQTSRIAHESKRLS